MSKKTRYLLILIGFLFFCAAAPLIVFYVRGITYNFASHKFINTGIMAIRTDPKSAKIYIDGKLKLNSNGDIRFLAPGEYDVAVKKDGYFDWSKRLNILPSQVTWASPAPDKLYLFLKDQKAADISSEVLDFYLNGDSLLYLTPKDLAISSPSSPAQSENVILPKAADSIISSPNGQIFILTNTAATSSPAVMVFNKNSRDISDFSQLFSGPVDFKFSGDNGLYALESGSLFAVDLKQKTKTLLKNGIKAYAFRENNLYYLQKKGNTTSLMLSQSPQEDGTEILSNIPDFTQGYVFVNFERQVLLILDNTLYQVAASLSKLTDNITDWNFNYNESTLIFSHAGELDYYNPLTHSVSFITRSSLPVKISELSLPFNNAFFAMDGNLEALELDSRGHQNNYIFYHGQNLQKFQLNSDLTNVYVLDSGNLKTIKIR